MTAAGFYRFAGVGQSLHSSEISSCCDELGPLGGHSQLIQENAGFSHIWCHHPGLVLGRLAGGQLCSGPAKLLLHLVPLFWMNVLGR